MSMLDKLLLAVRSIWVGGAPVTLPSGVTQPPVLNFASGATAAYNATTGNIDVTVTGGGSGGGQNPNTLGNGLNSNILTNGLPTLRLSGPSAAFSVGGFSLGGTTPTAGQTLAIINTTTQPMTLVNADASSTAKYRIDTQTNANVILIPGRKSTATFIYDGTASLWVLQSISYRSPYDLDVTEFGADPTGTVDSTTAIQNALNVCSGNTNLTPYKIVFPPGSYQISSTLTFTGNTSNGIRLYGDVAGALKGARIFWNGSTGAVMAHFYGLNKSNIENLIWDCNSIASVGPWFHSNQGAGGSPSNGVFFKSSKFLNAKPVYASCKAWPSSSNVGANTVINADTGYYYSNSSSGLTGMTSPTFNTCTTPGSTIADNTVTWTCEGYIASCLNVGDNVNGTAYQVSEFVWDGCTFTGYGYTSGGTYAGIQVLAPGAGNTETFVINNESEFSNLQYGFIFVNSNNTILVDGGTQFGAISIACIKTGFAQVTARQVQCENSGLSAPWTGKGQFLITTGSLCAAVIESCELAMDVSGNINNAIITTAGTLALSDTLVDGGGGGVSSAFASIALSGGAAIGGSTAGFDIDRCTFTNAPTTSTQPAVIDGSGNNLTQQGQNLYSQTNKLAYRLHGNKAQIVGGSTTYLLPDQYGSSPSLWSVGGIDYFVPAANGIQQAYRSQPRTVTTKYTIGFAAIPLATTFRLMAAQQYTTILRVYANVRATFTGGGLSACHMSVGWELGSFVEHIASTDVYTSTSQVFNTGTNLVTSYTGDTSNWNSGSTPYLDAKFTLVGGTTPTTGAVDIYITTEMVG